MFVGLLSVLGCLSVQLVASFKCQLMRVRLDYRLGRPVFQVRTVCLCYLTVNDLTLVVYTFRGYFDHFSPALYSRTVFPGVTVLVN